MSGLLGKVAGQLSGQKPSQSSNGSSGLMHKVTDTLTGQKHPQDFQNYQGPIPYSDGYQQPSHFMSAESRKYHEPPRYEEGHANYGPPRSDGFGPGHNNERGFYSSESTNGHGSYGGGYGVHAPGEREYSSHQAGYDGRGVSGGHEGYGGQHRWEYPEGGHNAPGSYEGHGGGGHNGPPSYVAGHEEHGIPRHSSGYGGYEGHGVGHNGPAYYAAGHEERGVSHNSSGYGGHGRGYGQYDGGYHISH